METSRQSNTLWDRAERLGDIVANDPGPLFERFRIRWNPGQNRIYTRCMVHHSNNPTSLSVYMGGYKLPFLWKCRTKHCDETFKKTAIGFARALLSSEELGWRAPGEPTVSFADTMKFLCELYRVDPATLQVDSQDREKRRFLCLTETLQEKAQGAKRVPRDAVRARLQIPSPYFLGRGFTPEILTKFDVGDCQDPTKEFYRRAVVPIYDESGQFFLGATGRSTLRECPTCFRFHEGSCTSLIAPAGKWHNSFNSSESLFNIWNAGEAMRKTGTAILVESPGNVLRLEEAGIRNAVAMLGSTLSTAQVDVLERHAIMSLVVVMDNDPAGQKAAEDIRKRCGKYYNMKFLWPEKNDVGEMTVDEVRQLLRGVIA